MKIILRPLIESDREAFFEGLNLFSDMERGWYTFVWQEGMSFKTLLEIMNNQAMGLNLDPGRVPATMLYAFLDGKIVGRSSIRHELNDFLIKFGGHVGFAVATNFRNRGIATEIMRQSINYCREVLKLKKILVTCDDDNLGSIKTIEKNNGILENKISEKDNGVLTRRYWIDLETI